MIHSHDQRNHNKKTESSYLTFRGSPVTLFILSAIYYQMPKPTSHRREFLKGKAFQKSLANNMEATHASHSSKQQASSADSTSYLLHITRKAMACDFQVFLNAGEHQHATETSVEALDLIEEIEDIISSRFYCRFA